MPQKIGFYAPIYAPNCAPKVGKVTKNASKKLHIHTKMQRKTLIYAYFLA